MNITRPSQLSPVFEFHALLPPQSASRFSPSLVLRLKKPIPLEHSVSQQMLSKHLQLDFFPFGCFDVPRGLDVGNVGNFQVDKEKNTTKERREREEKRERRER